MLLRTEKVFMPNVKDLHCNILHECHDSPNRCITSSDPVWPHDKLLEMRCVLTIGTLAIMFILVEGGTEYNGQEPERIISRGDFPPGFVFGASSSAYQYEGAAKVDGRGPTVMDVFAHTPGNIKDNSTGDVADDQFHRYKTDVELMKDMNLDAYRLSIGWTRLFPEGRGKKLNQLGVDHYNDVLDTLLKNGLKPYVTLQHFDVPQALEESYGSLLSTQFVEDYANYAEACFETFGDRVKNWITFNEPHIISSLGYARGIFPPQRCSAPFGNCTKGNSSTEPYIVAHHYLLAHATAVAIYRTRFQARQGGIIGITLDAESYEPLRNNSKDVAAVQRARDFELGWFLDPIMFGKYPTSMQKLVGHRLPKFTKEQIRVVKGSIDFIGLNHYSTSYVKALPKPAQGSPTGYPTDSQTLQTAYKNGVAIGSQVNGFNIVPRGIRILVNYVNTRYGDIPIVITENGISQTDNGSLSRVEALHDVVRVNYLKGYLSKLATGIRNGANVKGYFAWSLLDNWEFRSGYTVRYGLYYVDYKKNLTRYPKDSALWYKQFLAHA